VNLIPILVLLLWRRWIFNEYARSYIHPGISLHLKVSALSSEADCKIDDLLADAFIVGIEVVWYLGIVGQPVHVTLLLRFM
jgi:hypothetical protein